MDKIMAKWIVGGINGVVVFVAGLMFLAGPLSGAHEPEFSVGLVKALGVLVCLGMINLLLLVATADE